MPSRKKLTRPTAPSYARTTPNTTGKRPYLLKTRKVSNATKPK